MNATRSGWQQPARTAKCAHLGVLFASLGAYAHDVGHEWVCPCGKRFVVRQATVEGRTIKRLESAR